jgi:hypothetical protein
MAHFRVKQIVPVLPRASRPSSSALSSLLPPDLLAELCLSPESPSPGPDAVQCLRVPRSVFVPVCTSVFESSPPAAASLTCFEVRLASVSVFAVSIYESQRRSSPGVIVRQGPFLRYGTIVRQLARDECPTSSYQIVVFDSEGTLGRFLDRQARIARIFCGKFMLRERIETQIADLEIVSYRARGLLRIRLAGPAAPHIENLVQQLISVFCMPVEIYE